MPPDSILSNTNVKEVRKLRANYAMRDSTAPLTGSSGSLIRNTCLPRKRYFGSETALASFRDEAIFPTDREESTLRCEAMLKVRCHIHGVTVVTPKSETHLIVLGFKRNKDVGYSVI